MAALPDPKPHVLCIQELGGLDAERAPFQDCGAYRAHLGGHAFRRCAVLVPRDWTHLAEAVDGPRPEWPAVSLKTSAGRVRVTSVHVPHSGHGAASRLAAIADLDGYLVTHKAVIGADLNINVSTMVSDGVCIGRHVSPRTDFNGGDELDALTALLQTRKYRLANTFQDLGASPVWTHQQQGGESSIDFLITPQDIAIHNSRHELEDTYFLNSDHLAVSATMECQGLCHGPRRRHLKGWQLRESDQVQLRSHFNEQFSGRLDLNEWEGVIKEHVQPQMQPPWQPHRDPQDRWTREIEDNARWRRAASTPDQRRQFSRAIWRAKTARRRGRPLLEAQRQCQAGRLPTRKMPAQLASSFEGSTKVNEWPERAAEFLAQWTQPTREVHDIGGCLQRESEERREVARVGVGGEESIGEREIEQAISGMRRGKACGPDGITAEMLQALVGTVFVAMLAEFLQQIFAGQVVYPWNWRVISLFLIPKLPFPTSARALRPIALIPAMAKLYHGCLASRLEQSMRLPEWTLAYRRSYQCREIPQTLYLLLEQAQQWGEGLHLAKLDLMKAYDSIPIACVQEALVFVGVSWHLTRAVLDAICYREYSVIFAGHESTGWSMRNGLLQGDPMSPIVFNAVLAWTLAPAVQAWAHADMGVQVPGHARLMLLTYSDDVYLIARTAEQLARQLQDTETSLARASLQLQPTKSSYLAVGPAPDRISYASGGGRVSIDRAQTMTCMGIPLQGRGTGRACLLAMRCKVQRAFFAVMSTLRGTVLRPRWRLRLIMPLLQQVFRWFASLSPWTPSQLREVDAFQNRLAARILNPRRRPEEDGITHWRRRHRQSAAVLTEMRFPRWGLLALQSRLSFGGHLSRLPPGRLANAVLFYHSLSDWRLRQSTIAAGDASLRHPGRYNAWRWELAFERCAGTAAWHALAAHREAWRERVGAWLP